MHEQRHLEGVLELLVALLPLRADQLRRVVAPAQQVLAPAHHNVDSNTEFESGSGAKLRKSENQLTTAASRSGRATARPCAPERRAFASIFTFPGKVKKS